MKGEVSEPKIRKSALSDAEQFPGTAEGEVFIGDDKAVITLAHNRQAFAGNFAQWPMIEQDTG